MMIESRTTFAPAQRCDLSTVNAQAERVVANPVVEAILNAVNIPVFLLNQERQIVHTNEPFRTMFGAKDLAQVLGQRHGEVFRCLHAPAADASGGCGTGRACRTCESIRSVLRAQTHGKDERPCMFKLPQGLAMNVLFRATRVMIEGDQFVICAMLDIKDSIWHRDVQHSFLHDLMNIAGSIRSTSEALPHFEGPVQLEYIGRIQAACDTLINEIKSHRLMIHAEDGSLPLRFETLGSVAFLQAMTRILREHDVCQGRTLVVAPDSQEVFCQTDRGLLSRVLINLMKNALEASDPGQTVTTRTWAAEDQVCFSVHNPAFIPEQVARQIFSRFYSTRGAGRGIGTYSARLLTERYLGGSIGFTTDPEAGTTFTVHYPLRAAPSGLSGSHTSSSGRHCEERSDEAIEGEYW